MQTSAASARYQLTIFTPEAEVSNEVVLQAESGSIELAAWQGSSPPEWLETLARALLRTVWRTRTSDGEWPRRVTRWRPAPKA